MTRRAASANGRERPICAISTDVEPTRALARSTWIVATSLSMCFGCSELGHDDEPPFPILEGVKDGGTLGYPPSPYGVDEGDVIDDFDFQGYANSVAARTLASIRVGDFYNPTGEEVFPEGSPHGGGRPKPRALMINVSAVWCAPCNYEADAVLPGKHAELAPRGAEFLLVLADGPTPGKPAEVKHLDNWCDKYDVDFPSVLDPTGQITQFDADTFPGNMIIRTRTMEIVELTSGAPEEAFWTQLQGVLDEAPVATP